MLTRVELQRAALSLACRQHRLFGPNPLSRDMIERYTRTAGIPDAADVEELRRLVRHAWSSQESVPPKPDQDPESLDFEDYGFYLPGGKFKFWQGYDAKFKSRLMKVARDPGHPDNERAVAELARRCWSTPEYEWEIRDRNARRAQKETMPA